MTRAEALALTEGGAAVWEPGIGGFRGHSYLRPGGADWLRLGAHIRPPVDGYRLWGWELGPGVGLDFDDDDSCGGAPTEGEAKAAALAALRRQLARR